MSDRRSILHRMLVDRALDLPGPIADGLREVKSAGQRVVVAGKLLIGIDQGGWPSRSAVQVIEADSDGIRVVRGWHPETIIVGYPDEASSGGEAMVPNGELVSLISGDTAAERKARSAVKSADAAGPPAGTAGVDTHGSRWLHIAIHLPDSSTSIDWQLWILDETSGLWCLDTRLGSGGTVTLAQADADNPQWSVAEIGGQSKVWIKLSSMTGTFTDGVDVWLSGSGRL